MITDRDRRILALLSELRYMTTKQIQEIFFSNVNPSISYKRLDHLIKCNLIKRKYFNIDKKKNVYVYYLDKPPTKKALLHELLLSEFVAELIRQGNEILEIEKAQFYKGIIPDGVIKFKKRDGTIKHVFVEVQLSKHDCISKYHNINPNGNQDTPNQLWVITDKPQEEHKIRNLRIIIDDIELTKLQRYFT